MHDFVDQVIVSAKRSQLEPAAGPRLGKTFHYVISLVNLGPAIELTAVTSDEQLATATYIHRPS